MLILHAAQVKGNLVLWSEDSEPLPGPADRQTDGSHPFCAQAQLVAEAVGLETGGDSFASAIAWLPSRGDFPVPSSSMAGRLSRAVQLHGRSHAQVASQAAHQAMDRNNTPFRESARPSWRPR